MMQYHNQQGIMTIEVTERMVRVRSGDQTYLKIKRCDNINSFKLLFSIVELYLVITY